MKAEKRVEKKNSSSLKKMRKIQTGVGTRVGEEMEKSGMVLQKTVTLEDE